MGIAGLDDDRTLDLGIGGRAIASGRTTWHGLKKQNYFQELEHRLP